MQSHFAQSRISRDLFSMSKTERVDVSDGAILTSSAMLLLWLAGQGEFQCVGDDGGRKT